MDPIAPDLTPDTDLVLAPPQHYHVTCIVYRETTSTGFTFSTAFDLVANDVRLARQRALRLGTEANVHVRDVRQCADPDHLLGMRQ